MAAGYVILEVAWEQSYVHTPFLQNIISEFKLTHTYVIIDIQFKMIPAIAYTPKKKFFFQAGVHCIYKQKPKVLSGYCCNNCKVYKLVEFHKHTCRSMLSLSSNNNKLDIKQTDLLKMLFTISLQPKSKQLRWYLVSRIIKKNWLAFSLNCCLASCF